MKNFNIYLTVFLSFIFMACNKDEDITIENPEDNPSGFPSFSLGYTVLEYTPAPGQYINENVSGFNNISSMEEATKQAESRLANQNYVSLGAWGGYITVKFNEPIINNKEYNFAVAGNAFDTSNEPGIVWVMKDTNHNGLPDDTWYELRGSYYNHPGYQRNYWVKYYRPNPKEDTRWEDSDGHTGYIIWLGTYHKQDYYYPNWIKEDSYTLHGSRLPSLSQQDTDTGIWSNPSYEWGYADNHGEDIIEININGKVMEANSFRISDAIDSEGHNVNLESIDFIKVQTAINGESNILGENSTEVCGFFAL